MQKRFLWRSFSQCKISWSPPPVLFLLAVSTGVDPVPHLCQLWSRHLAKLWGQCQHLYDSASQTVNDYGGCFHFHCEHSPCHAARIAGSPWYGEGSSPPSFVLSSSMEHGLSSQCAEKFTAVLRLDALFEESWDAFSLCWRSQHKSLSVQSIPLFFFFLFTYSPQFSLSLTDIFIARLWSGKLWVGKVQGQDVQNSAAHLWRGAQQERPQLLKEWNVRWWRSWAHWGDGGKGGAFRAKSL